MSFIFRFFLLVLVLSFCELYLLILVANEISLVLTLALCVLTGVLGGAMVRAQGFSTFRVIREAMTHGRLPATEIVAGLILVVIGTMLLTPGFITDTVAFLLLIPPLRALAAGALVQYFKRRISVRHFRGGRQTHGPEGVVIEVDAEPVDDDEDRRPPKALS